MYLKLFAVIIFATEVFTSDHLLDQEYYDLNNVEEIFAQYIEKYGKNYEDRSDYHFDVFKENLEKINKWNEESSETKYGINEFTDVTFEEFSKTYLGFNGNASPNDAVKYKPSGLQAPGSLDYRQYGYVTEIKNQGRCGSCFVFSAIGNIEGQYAKKHQTRAISLSEQQGLDCGGTCDGGFPHQVFQNLAAQGGSMREEEYPYEGHQSQCRTQRNRIAVQVTGGMQLAINGEESLKDAVANIGPLSVAVCVDDSFKAYRGGVFVPRVPCPQGNHAVTLIGYGNEGNNYWLIKNSWGLSWGEQGFMRLVRGQNAAAIGSYAASSNVV